MQHPTMLIIYDELRRQINHVIDQAIDRIPEEHRAGAKENREHFFKVILQHYYDHNELPNFDITYKGQVI